MIPRILFLLFYSFSVSNCRFGPTIIMPEDGHMAETWCELLMYIVPCDVSSVAIFYI
jgi:hypothetical protein